MVIELVKIQPAVLSDHGKTNKQTDAKAENYSDDHSLCKTDKKCKMVEK